MQHQTSLGANRTGIQMSPVDAERMQTSADATPIDGGDADGYLRVRQDYIDDDEGLGSVPPPGTLKGLAKSGLQMATGKRPQALVDKLGERLAFERGGVRLYDTLLAKCEAAVDGLSAETLTELRRFRNEEAQHMQLVVSAIERLGADPTAQTPSADLVGVEAMGLVQAMNDPRTNVLQSLHVMLDAEVLDNSAWNLLIELVQAMGQDEIAEDFALAQQQEAVHLTRLRELVSTMTVSDASAGRVTDEAANDAS
jgi:ferritin-like protein